ncbi:MAG: DUF1501 domain-containing protein [Planctomycetaceae bacterium]|nr:DUF1501 domain-containing protein [Planctomycetaceae bacterium]
MLTILGSKQQYCDGMRRRDFLRIGALGGALSLPELLLGRAQAETAGRSSRKAVIMVCLNGGPSHLDMYDLKPKAPVEIRGEFEPIPTNVPGIEISELMPMQARIADKLAIVRSAQWPLDDGHHLHLMFSGFRKTDQRPSFGSIVSRVRSERGVKDPLPPYISMAQFPPHPVLAGHEEPTYVGARHRPFVPWTAGDLINTQINYTGPGMGAIKNLDPVDGVTLGRMSSRSSLLAQLDRFRSEVDARGEMDGVDSFTHRALDMISSPRVREALDLSREPPEMHALYGGDIPWKGDPDPRRCWEGSKFLMARRLVEAGVPVVTLAAGVWDTHSMHFPYQRGYVPLLDRSIHALVTDLHARGMDRDVAVVVCGEMGRTPRVNKSAGRDHWAPAGFALFAGGGLRMGQTIGATDAQGDRPATRPYGPQNILATLYHVLGIDTTLTFPDHAGRPRYVLDDRETIAELM